MTGAVRARVGVLASGGGSNLQAVLDHADALGDRRHYDVALVCANDAPADGDALLRQLDAHGVDLVVLAGYLKLVPGEVARRFHGRMLNVHPALLPAFGGPGMYGIRVHRAVLAAGARLSGATVHFVDEHYDRGAIVAQWPVPAYADDTPESLAARVLRVEHRLLPRVVDAVAAGRVSLDADGRARGVFAAPADGARDAAGDAAFVVSADPALLHAQLDHALGDPAP